MPQSFSQAARCASCAAPLPRVVRAPVCPRCMLAAGLREREEDIRQEVSGLPSPADRAAYMEAVCAHDPTLRRRVTASLSLEAGAGAISQPAPDEFPQLGGMASRYKIIREIGEGGFGVVYLAEQTEPVRRQVALKILKLGMDTKQVVSRFQTERQTLAMMDHPHIAKMFDAGATGDGRPYFVMDLVRGLPITRYCDENELSIRRRLELFSEVCRAIQHAHQKGIIHRDIKPSNILVADHDGSPAPKIIDFGIAKATQQELSDRTVLTQLHQFIGTPAYISPEQAAMNPAGGEDIDTRSDIYSLGVLLYELLTGSTPFDTKELVASGLDQMRRIIREKDPVAPSTRLARETNPKSQTSSLKSPVDRDLDWIAMKCLQKEPARRYATANELAADIERYLAGEPVLARPPSFWYRCSKLVRRNPLVTALAALLLLAVAAASFVGTSLALRLAAAKQETDRANLRLLEHIRQLEWQKAEDLAAMGKRRQAMAWFARRLRENPNDTIAASRVLSMLTLNNFALPVIEPLSHDGPVNTVHLSPDGAQVLTASDDRTVRFWNAADGRLLRTLRQPAEAASARYIAGGTRVIVTTKDLAARVYDTANGTLLFETNNLTGPHAWVECADVQSLLCFHRDRTVSKWDLRSNRQTTAWEPASRPVRSGLVSRSGHCLALLFDDNIVSILSDPDGRPLVPARRFDTRVEGMAFTPDGRRLMIAIDKGRRVALWDYQDANRLTEFVPPPPARISSLAVTPDGRRLITRAYDDPLRVWDAQTLQPVADPRVLTLGQTDFRLNTDGSQIAFFSQERGARLLDGLNGAPLMEPIEHQGPILDLVFHPSGGQLATASQDGTVRLWDVRMREPRQLLLPDARGGGEASFSSDESRIVCSVDHDAVQICDARTARPLSPPLRHPPRPGGAHIRRASFSPDGSKLLTAGHGGLLRIWDAVAFQPLVDIEAGGTVMVANFSPDGRWIVTGDIEGFTRIWDPNTGQLLAPAARHGDEITSLDFHPHRPVFLVACANGTAWCRELPTNRSVIGPLRHHGIIWNARYSTDGNRIVTASADSTAQVWDSRTGRPLIRPLRHGHDVLSACFSPDGRRVLTTSADGTARVWDARTGNPLSQPMRHAGRVWLGRFSPDGLRVATGSDDFTARIWDAPTGLPMSEPLRHSNALGRLAFTRDGQRLLSFGGSPPRLWDLIQAPAPVPPWFCDLIEAIAGLRLDQDGEPLPASSEPLARIRQSITATQPGDFYSHWTKWFLLDRRGQSEQVTVSTPPLQ